MGTQQLARAGTLIPAAASNMKKSKAEDDSLAMSVREAGRMLDRSPSTIYRMVGQGLLKMIQCPKRPKVLRKSVLDYVAKQARRAAPRKPPGKANGSKK